MSYFIVCQTFSVCAIFGVEYIGNESEGFVLGGTEKISQNPWTDGQNNKMDFQCFRCAFLFSMYWALNLALSARLVALHYVINILNNLDINLYYLCSHQLYAPQLQSY